MRIASADFSWPGLRPEFVLDLIRELELDGVSLAYFGGLTERTPQRIADDPVAWGEQVAAELAERGLAPADTFFVPSADLVGMAVNHPDPTERAGGSELFAAFCEFAERVGTSGITTLPGLVFARPFSTRLPSTS